MRGLMEAEAVAASGPMDATVEHALAALELLCAAAGGTTAVRREALASPVLARAMEGMSGCGRESAIGVPCARAHHRLHVTEDHHGRHRSFSLSRLHQPAPL